MNAADAPDRDPDAELREPTPPLGGEAAELEARGAEAEARMIAHQDARASDKPYEEAEEEAYQRALEGQRRARGLEPD